jgi:hypothetical protein
MRMNLKMILAATAIAAVASPVMAQSESQTHAAPLPASISNAHGHVVRGRTAAVDVAKGSEIRPADCAHATFPQCGDDATLPQTDRP